MDFSEDYKNGVVDAISGVITLIFSECNQELKEMILKRLKLKEIDEDTEEPIEIDE